MKIILISLAFVFLLFSCDSKEDSPISVTEEDSPIPIPVTELELDLPVWAGGVQGIESFSFSASSANFRSKGGKLYIHSVGWTKLNIKQRNAVLNDFGKTGMGIEIGYSPANIRAYQIQYKSLDCIPAFITSNCMALKNMPELAGWKSFVDSIRKVSGISDVFPTFEFQNQYIGSKLSVNEVSKNGLFQEMILYSGGLTIDCPPRFYYKRTDEEYRVFVRDAIKWTKSKGKKVYLIASPNDDMRLFKSSSKRIFTELIEKGALPDGIVCENYNTTNITSNSGEAGPEDLENSSLNVGITLLGK